MPEGPSIQESTGKQGQSSTYEKRDALNNKHDENLFDYYAATQLALVDTATLSITPIGKPGNFDAIVPAPDGRHVLVAAIHKPYSYLTTYQRFPRDVQVWDTANRANIAVHTITSRPLEDRVPIHGVPVGPRDFSWRATESATLVWAEALDGGDWSVTVPARDKLLMQAAPFSTPAVEIARTEQRLNSLLWTEKPGLALLQEYDHNRHWERTFIVNVDDAQQKPRLLWDLSSEEKYADPGTPQLSRLPNGARVIRMDGDSIYLSGAGASPDGARPFFDRLDLSSLKTERLFRSEADAYEHFLSFSGADARSFVTWRQTVV